jgi:ATP-binding cassette subfamily B protein
MEKRAAFSRAWGFLNFKPAAKWLALAAGIASSVVQVGVLVVIGLLADLLAHRGQPTDFSDLGLVGRPMGSLLAGTVWIAELNADRPGFGSLVGLASLGVILALVGGLLEFARRYLASLAATEAATRLRRAVYHHSFRLGALAFRPGGPAEAVSMFTRHTETIRDALLGRLTVAFREPVLLLLLVAVALLVKFGLALVIALAAILASVLLGQIAAGFHGPATRATQQAAGHLALVQESLMLVRVVKSYVMEIFSQARVERQLAAYGRAQRRRDLTEALERSVVMVLGGMAAVALLFVVGWLVLDSPPRLSLAAVILLAALLASLPAPCRRWLDYRRLLERGQESAAALFTFLDRPGDVSQVVGAETLPRLSNRLEFDTVSLRDPGGARLLLQEVSLTIAAGEHVAIVGPDDQEKHALVYLLPRFIDPTSGEIRIDEHNLRWVTLESIRKQLGLVVGPTFVFNDTVTHNISGGESTIPLPRIIEAAKLAHAHQFIQKLPKGYDTPIGEMGHSLTVGEQFRIALARAIVRNPALFIIEEPAAFYLDEDTRDLLDDSYARVLAGRTVIFLPHREATLRACSQVLVLYLGRIHAQGEHQELLQQNALYHRLYFASIAGETMKQSVT